MKIGTKVIVNDKTAKAWGYKTPATGIIAGPDPRGFNKKVFSVKLDEEDHSIFEAKGCHEANFQKVK